VEHVDQTAKKAYGKAVETKFFGSALLRCPDLGAKQVTPQKSDVSITAATIASAYLTLGSTTRISPSWQQVP
jgi:hypothetical protein